MTLKLIFPAFAFGQNRIIESKFPIPPETTIQQTKYIKW